MKNIRRNSVIILLITIGILVYLLKDNYHEIVNALINANVLWIILAIIFYLIYFIFDKFSLYNLTKNYKDDISLKYIFHIGVITRFFDGITPLASGGQPYQVYALHKKGVSIGNGTNIVIQNYIVYQIAFVIIAIISYTLNHTMHLFKEIPLLKELTTIGFTANGIILVLLILIVFSKNFNKTVVKFAIKVTSIFNKKMNKEETIAKWDKRCHDYYLSGQVLLKNKAKFIKCIGYQLISISSYYILTLPLAYAIGVGNLIPFVAIYSGGSYTYNMGCYVPIPGATGGMEYGFLGFYGNYINGSSLSTLVILWRFITYYMPTLIGALVFNFKDLRKDKKELKEQKII